MTFNLIDVTLGCILILSLIVSRGLSFIKELIKFIGVLLATIITLHYYIPFGEYLKFKQLIPEPLNYLMAFIISIAFIVLVFALLSEGWILIIKFELPSSIEKVASWIFSFLRTYFVFGLIYVALLVTGGTVEREARNSYSQVILGSASVWVYQGFFSGVVKFFSPDEVAREDVVNFILGQEPQKKLPKDETTDQVANEEISGS